MNNLGPIRSERIELKTEDGGTYVLLDGEKKAFFNSRSGHYTDAEIFAHGIEKGLNSERTSEATAR